MASPSDSVLRAITNDGAFRVITARTTETVREACRLQGASGMTARHFCDLITGTVLVRETMSPQLRVQGIVRGADNRGSMVADSHPDGSARGLVQLKEGQSELSLGPSAVLQMMRTLYNGQLHQGIVELPQSAGISGGIMNYMQTSEQITCVTAVSTLIGREGVHEAGGYVVQLLPEAHVGALMVMTERLSEFASMESILASDEFTPKLLAEELLYGMPFMQTDESPLRFECNCSLVRVVAGLATLQSSVIKGLIDEGKVLEISCDFCGKHYEVMPEQLRGLLKSN